MGFPVCCCTEREKYDDGKKEIRGSHPDYERQLSENGYGRQSILDDKRGIRTNQQFNPGISSIRQKKNKDQGGQAAVQQRQSINKHVYDGLLNETYLSQRSSSTPHGNTLNEFAMEPRLMGKHEKKYEWSKQGIISLFDNVNSIYTFTNLLNEPGCRFWINEKGYHFFKYFPLFKTEYLFDSQFTMDQVIQALHDPQRRIQWDKNIHKQRILRNVNRVQIMHTVNTPHILENTVRDMYEKKLGFTYRPPVSTSRIDDQFSNGKNTITEEMFRNEKDDAKNQNGGRSTFKFQSDQIEYYMFSSSIDNKELMTECPLQKDQVRIQVYLTLQKFELVRVPNIEEEKFQVRMTGFLQCDPKLSKLKYGIYRSALPSFTKDFYTSLVAYLEQSRK